MKHSSVRAAILHAGPWKDVFGDFPAHLSACTGLPITERPDGLDLAYVLGWFERKPLPCESFIPLDAVYLAHDKRRQAKFFSENGIAAPESLLVGTEDEVLAFSRTRPDKEWLLKWPVGCGGIGHQVLDAKTEITPLWRPPFLVQELIRMERPRVYRFFSAGGETFNWCVRESNEKTARTPFISARGGATVRLEDPVPEAARAEAERALKAAGLWDTLGAVDMIRSDAGRWFVIELNTDGIYHFLRRVVDVPGFTATLDRFTNRAVQKRLAGLAAGRAETGSAADGGRNSR